MGLIMTPAGYNQSNIPAFLHQGYVCRVDSKLFPFECKLEVRWSRIYLRESTDAYSVLIVFKKIRQIFKSIDSLTFHQTGATQSHAHLGLPDKGRAIKGMVVCNNWDLEPLDLRNGLALGCYQPSPEVLSFLQITNN